MSSFKLYKYVNFEYNLWLELHKKVNIFNVSYTNNNYIALSPLKQYKNIILILYC